MYSADPNRLISASHDVDQYHRSFFVIDIFHSVVSLMPIRYRSRLSLIGHKDDRHNENGHRHSDGLRFQHWHVPCDRYQERCCVLLLTHLVICTLCFLMVH